MRRELKVYLAGLLVGGAEHVNLMRRELKVEVTAGGDGSFSAPMNLMRRELKAPSANLALVTLASAESHEERIERNTPTLLGKKRVISKNLMRRELKGKHYGLKEGRRIRLGLNLMRRELKGKDYWHGRSG